MNKIIKDIIQLLLAVLLLNILSCFLFFRWDFTSSKRYSLSKASKKIIKQNTEPITVDLYVTKDLPHDIRKLAMEFRALLKEYRSLSNAGFTINTICPDNQEKEFNATHAGVIPIYKEVRERDMVKVQRIFFGTVIHIGDRKTTIPVINFDTPLEYEITRLIKQASDTIKPMAGFVYGHGESTFKQMNRLDKKLSNLTNVQYVNLNNDVSPDSYNVLCIIDPKETYSADEIKRLEKYLAEGGRLFLALNHAIGQLGDRNNGFINPTGIENMLEKMGLKIKYDFVVDNNCGSIAIDQRYGLFEFQTNISFPYLPIITNFSKHTITYGLRSMLLPFASSIEQVKTQNSYTFYPLARTSGFSGIKQAPVFFNLQKQWTHNDFNHPYNIVAALLTNEHNNSAIVTITDADFISNSIANSSHTDNITFAVNSIEWLADNSGLIQLRNKFTTFSTLKPIGDKAKETIKYLNFLLPIIILALAASLQLRKKRRNSIYRTQSGYID